MNISYYDEHADSYVEQTVNIDMSPIYERFLPLLPTEGSILDAGCGSGRDAKAFQDRSFRVVAFDASAEMCKRASKLLGRTVHQLRFEEIQWESEFDGVWACASLLHLTAEKVEKNIAGLLRVLKPGGVMYLSFKYGKGETISGGRTFINMDEQSLQDQLERIPKIGAVETWVTTDRRPDRGTGLWLNAIVTKKA